MTDGQEVNRLNLVLKAQQKILHNTQLEVASLKKKTLLAESELAIIKGIGNNSPEMKSLKSEVAALKQQLHTERESLKKEADELMMKKIEHYEKEIALVREDAQVQILRLEKRNSEHQKLNGELQVKLSKYEDKAAHYRRKAIL